MQKTGSIRFLGGLSGQRLSFLFAAVSLVGICGCGEFFASKQTELESESIRREMCEIRLVEDINDIPMPNIFDEPPRVVKQTVAGGEEWKLFYFCRHHTVDKLVEIINDQFSSKLFNAKGKSETLPNYKVSSNPATNQLIVRCPTEQDVKAVLEVLEIVDVAPIQVKISCLISEVYADKTLDWETTVQVFDLFGEDIAMGGSAQPFGVDVLDLVQEGAILPAFPGASLREVARAKMGLKIGYASEKHNFLAMVDLLESKGYLKILMNPTLEVVNGQKATIKSSERVPLEKVYLRDREGFVESKTEYVDVVDSLEIIPHVFADGHIGLETTALIGSKATPEGVKQIRIVTKREIYNKENRIRHGESLVIGGIRKSEQHAVVRGIPVLKDIPIIGVLFSSKDFEERAIETIFILTPTISEGGIPNAEMAERMRRRHAPAEPSDIQGKMLYPLGSKARERELQRQLRQLREERLKAETANAQRESKVAGAPESKVAESPVKGPTTTVLESQGTSRDMGVMLENLGKSLEELKSN